VVCCSIVIPGKVIFLHPVHSFAILRYDPSLVEPTIPRVTLSTTEIKPGDSTLFFKVNNGGNLELSPTYVAGVCTFSCIPRISPGVTAVSVESLTVDTNIPVFASGCGLISEDGMVQALWLGRYCVPISIFVPVLKMVEHDLTRAPTIRLLGARLHSIETGSAKALGVPQGK
jgi:hypothetical protein